MSIDLTSLPPHTDTATAPDKETLSTRFSGAKKALVTAGLVAGLTFAGAAAASATVVSAGGGTWDYGVTNLLPSTNWSNYYHGSKKHGSSVEGDAGLVRSPCVAKNRWSYASAWDTNPFRIDHAYWRHC
ncbi:MAG: lactococcin 972 family bacteriocin [Micropruina sp.]|uniref:lactococcin 972 family bacteriocin n=1 Tax=Micropruina sp. TaxID=2737536 RepID=UPI0039E32785